MRIVCLALLLASTGCARYVVPADITDDVAHTSLHSSGVDTPTAAVLAMRLTDKQKLYLLDKEAKKRNLRYWIFCIGPSWDDKTGPEHYQANAEHREAKVGAHYVDEGRMDEWMVGAGSTSQADAAFALYQSIQGTPTHLASQWFVRPPKHEEKPRQCMPEIKGNY